LIYLFLKFNLNKTYIGRACLCFFQGANFVSDASLVSVELSRLARLQPRGANATRDRNVTCAVESSSPTKIVCTLPENTGSNYVLTVTVDVLESPGYDCDAACVSAKNSLDCPAALYASASGAAAAGSRFLYDGDDCVRVARDAFLFSYGAPTLETLLPSRNAAITGAEQLVIKGTNFGPQLDDASPHWWLRKNTYGARKRKK
jgi:hypothetical protein